MDVPKTSINNTLPFTGVHDPDLKNDWCLIDGNGMELSVIYICPRTGHFLACNRRSLSDRINPLEYTKDGKFTGFSNRYDIKGKKRVVNDKLL